MTITLKVSENTKTKMQEFYKDTMRPKTPPYAVFQADSEDTVVTLYESGKAVFQGISADIDAAMWRQIEKNLNPDKKIEMTNSDDKKKSDKDKKQIIIDPKIYNASSIGSDEVGTGDFLAPIVVCAAYVDNSTMQLIKEFNVHDSKKISDSVILKVVPTILKKIHYSCKILSNDKYNHLVARGLSMNAIKAILHNACLTSLHKRCPYVNNIYVDKFCEEDKYYFYISTQEQKTTNIVFKEKGETFFPSVALASWVARYYLLIETKNLSTKLKMEVPLGASKTVDEFVTNYLKSHTLDDLKLICKTNFVNFKNLLEVKLF